MTVILAGEAPRFELPGVELTALAAPSRGSTDLCTWRLSVAPAFSTPEPHTLDSDEVFLVLSGSARITPYGPALAPGDVQIVPAGQPIQLVNSSDAPAELLVTIRAGFIATMADGSTVYPPWAQ